MIFFRNTEDEIDTFEYMKNIELAQNFWKINELPVHKRYPAFKSIDFYLHLKQKLNFYDEYEIVEINNESQKET